MSNKVSVFPNQKVKNRTQTMMLYIGIFSIVMLFAGVTSAYVVSMSDGFWVSIKQPTSFYWSTLVIVLSSLSIQGAYKSVQKGAWGRGKYFLAVTMALGIVFSLLQYKGWSELISSGNYLVGNPNTLNGEYGEDYYFLLNGEPMQQVEGDLYAHDDLYLERPLKEDLMGTRNAASSYVYILTGLHLAHLVGGFIYLIFLFFRVSQSEPSDNQVLSVKLGSIYWHFLDFLWVYLFLFLIFIH